MKTFEYVTNNFEFVPFSVSRKMQLGGMLLDIKHLCLQSEMFHEDVVFNLLRVKMYFSTFAMYPLDTTLMIEKQRSNSWVPYLPFFAG